MLGIPALMLTARRYFKRKDRRDSVGSAMLLGSMILSIVIITEVSGYVTFATRLFDATFGTILLILFTVMLLHIVGGGIELFFTMQKVSSKQFVKQLGKQAPQRFKLLFRIILIVSALNYLFVIWGIAEGFENVWNAILGLKFSIGEFSLSLQMVLLVLLVLYLTMLISWIVQSFIESQIFYQKRIDRGIRDAVKKLTHYILILIGFLVAMSMAGIDLKNLTILAGAFGIGIGFGLQGIVNNFISGLILLFERPVKVGDTIVVGETTGVINHIGMRSTVVETWDRSEIIVPNSQMISEKVTNWTLSSCVARVVLPVGVKYGTDMQKVISLLESIAAEHELVVDDPQPSAVFTGFGNSSIDFQLRAWIEDVDNRLKVRSALGVAIDKAFREHKIEIPFPQRDLHLRSVEPGIIAAGSKGPAQKRPTPHKKTVPTKKPKD
jgi:small-conductance mechanosensitive channel